MKKAPKVTVFMPVYNGEKYLKEAIESILVQTFPDFELLIIDDGSTDGSVTVVKSIHDSRIRFIQNERNMGLPYTRNKGFELAKGEYIAFIDCDDTSAPDRLEKQVNFMEEHPEVGICGSWVQDVTSEGRLIAGKVRQYPAEDRKIRHMLLWSPPLWNPSLILRRRVIIDHNLFHNPMYIIGEDYDLWVRASKVTQLANIPEILHYYRRHDLQISTRKSVEAVWNVCNLQLGVLFDLIKKYFPQEELGTLETDLANPKLLTKNILAVDRLIEKIKENNILTGEVSHKTLEASHRDLWYKFLSGLPRFDLKLYNAIRQSSFFRTLSYPVRLKLWLKCLAGMRQEWILQMNNLKTALDRKVAVQQ
jgi:glycosyltransferase involved in cell wall biosynthesis